MPADPGAPAQRSPEAEELRFGSPPRQPRPSSAPQRVCQPAQYFQCQLWPCKATIIKYTCGSAQASTCVKLSLRQRVAQLDADNTDLTARCRTLEAEVAGAHPLLALSTSKQSFMVPHARFGSKFQSFP